MPLLIEINYSFRKRKQSVKPNQPTAIKNVTSSLIYTMYIHILLCEIVWTQSFIRKHFGQKLDCRWKKEKKHNNDLHSVENFSLCVFWHWNIASKLGHSFTFTFQYFIQIYSSFPTIANVQHGKPTRRGKNNREVNFTICQLRFVCSFKFLLLLLDADLLSHANECAMVA